MRLHRFYVGVEHELGHHVWLKDERILHQWQKVLRYRAGQEVVLFDGVIHDRLYVITEIKKEAAHLELITDFERKLPAKNVYLLWALLKKDKNDWVLQKCTELGVSHFVPVLAERSEKTSFHLERAEKIITEAAEQCGRSDIPKVREPVLLPAAVHQYAQKVPLFMCEQESLGKKKQPNYADVGVLIGPEGGWSDNEKQLFLSAELPRLSLGNFTLRAETAAVAASTKLLI
jgi:16S rRNA (uracil1498-N3)-methyltransferase